MHSATQLLGVSCRVHNNTGLFMELEIKVVDVAIFNILASRRLKPLRTRGKRTEWARPEQGAASELSVEKPSMPQCQQKVETPAEIL